MEFIFENILGFFALLVMLVSVVLQINHIKYKRGAKKQKALVTKVIPCRFWKKIFIAFDFEGQKYEAQALNFNPSLQKDLDIEILVNPLALTRFNHPHWWQKILNRFAWTKKETPTILLNDPNIMIYHFGLIVFCLIIMSFN